ncbi:hypothetical protein [Methylobacillus sp.]|uniref:hypothetical protein n=1 Tax=Methylobacillus sp. TaxID=56818 RepID=UPI002FE0FD4D
MHEGLTVDKIMTRQAGKMSANTSDNGTGLGTLFDQHPQTAFVYVKIPLKLHARSDPFHQRENELARLLQEAKAGEVIGWGQSLGDSMQDGALPVIYQRIDITTSDIDFARTTLRSELETLGVPTGTEIHYSRAGTMLMDVYRRQHWQLDQPSF